MSQPTIEKEIAENFGVDLPLTPLVGGVMNENYRSTRGGKGVVIRILRRSTVEEAAIEYSLLTHLAQYDVPTPRVIEGGVVSVDGSPAYGYYFMEGQVLEGVNQKVLTSLGSTLASIHRALSSYDGPIRSSVWEPERLTGLYADAREGLCERAEMYDPSLIDLWDENLQRYSFKDLPSGATHQDAKPDNVLVEGDEVVGVLDFSNAYYGSLLHDLVTTAIWSVYEDGVLRPELLTALVAGYEHVRSLDPSEREQFSMAMEARLLRETLIGPLVTVGNDELVFERSQYFKRCYESFDKSVIEKVI